MINAKCLALCLSVALLANCSNLGIKQETQDVNSSPFVASEIDAYFPSYGKLVSAYPLLSPIKQGLKPGRFKFSLLNELETFSVDEESGEISIKELQRVRRYDSYRLELKAVDNNSKKVHTNTVVFNAHKFAKAGDWFNPFPANGESQVYIHSRDWAKNRDSSDIIFENNGHELKALFKWTEDYAPFAMISTLTQYSHYDFELEYRWGQRKFEPRAEKKRDAGIVFHFQNDAEVWPVSLECQIQEGDTGDHFSIRGPSVTAIAQDGSRKLNSSRAKDGSRGGARIVRWENNENDSWNKVRIEIRGDSGKYFVNGKLVNQFEQAINYDGTPLTQGRIGLQAEGAEVIYRNIRMRKVDE